MKMKRYLMAVGALLLAIFVLIGSPAYAAKPVTSGVVFTIEPHPQFDANAVAREWSRNTDVSVNVGACPAEDKFCIRLSVLDAPCGGAAGCAHSDVDGNRPCLVEVDPDYLGSKLGLWITMHEVGHCIWHVGGRFGHIGSYNEYLMSPFAPSNPKGKIGLTDYDREVTRSLF